MAKADEKKKINVGENWTPYYHQHKSNQNSLHQTYCSV